MPDGIPGNSAGLGIGDTAKSFPPLAPRPGGGGSPPEMVNRYSLPSGSATAGAAWYSIVVDRPTILRPAVPLLGQVYYHPDKIGALSDQDTFKSISFGLVYLFAPGKWWIKYAVTTASPTLFYTLDATDPVNAWRHLAEPGANFPFTGRFAVTNANTGILAGDVEYEFIILQNNEASPGGEDICVNFSAAAVFPAGAAGAGLVLKKGGGGNGTLILAGPTLLRGSLNAIIATPAVTAYLDVVVGR